MKKNIKTQAVHAGSKRSQYGELSEAIFLTQGFQYPTAEAAEKRFLDMGEDEYIYARYSNPTVRMFEERMMAIEGAEDAFATASGMAGIHAALFSYLKAGDHVVSAKALFGSCLYIVEDLLPRFGVEVTLVDGLDLKAWRAAMKPNTKLCFLESISNPTLEVIDIEAVAKIAHENNALLVVDNVFATPVFNNPIELGADVIVYSATKHIDGQGRCLGGIVLGSKKYIRDSFEPFIKHTGGAMSPFTAWVMLKGLETLPLRCDAQADAALELALALEDHPKLKKVIYPHLASHAQNDVAKRTLKKGGTVVTLEIDGDKTDTFKFLNALDIFLITNNLGDAKSLATHPSTTTHQRLSEAQQRELGIHAGTVRLSIGLEDVDDLIADITNALNQV